MTTDLEALEKIHASLGQLKAIAWTGYESECLNALPALLAELRLLRTLRDDVTEHCGNTPACRYRPVEVTLDGATITVMNSADSHRLSAALDELRALREVARVARAMSPPLGDGWRRSEYDDLYAALAKVPR